MVELVKAGFYPFVLTLSENVVKKVVWDIYFTIKADSGRIPAMKLSGAAGFATVCLMKEFGCIRENENLVKQCNYIFYQIFQYTPGFIHAKQCVCDGEAATCGTINMDYRSYYLHYENGIWMSGEQIQEDIRKDFCATFEESHEVSYEEWKNRPRRYKFIEPVLNLFSILL